MTKHMKHGCLHNTAIWCPSFENVTLGLRSRATFSTSGSSYFNVHSLPSIICILSVASTASGVCSVIMEQLGVQHLTSESDPQVPCSENYTTVHNHLFYTLFTNEYWPNAQITHYDDDVVTNWYIGRHFKLSGQSRNTLLCHVLILEAQFACTLTNNRELSGIQQSPCSITTHLSPRYCTCQACISTYRSLATFSHITQICIKLTCNTSV